MNRRTVRHSSCRRIPNRLLRGFALAPLRGRNRGRFPPRESFQSCPRALALRAMLRWASAREVDSPPPLLPPRSRAIGCSAERRPRARRQASERRSVHANSGRVNTSCSLCGKWEQPKPCFVDGVGCPAEEEKTGVWREESGGQKVQRSSYGAQRLTLPSSSPPSASQPGTVGAWQSCEADSGQRPPSIRFATQGRLRRAQRARRNAREFTSRADAHRSIGAAAPERTRAELRWSARENRAVGFLSHPLAVNSP